MRIALKNKFVPRLGKHIFPSHTPCQHSALLHSHSHYVGHCNFPQSFSLLHVCECVLVSVSFVLADNGKSFCCGSIKYLLDTIYNIFRCHNTHTQVKVSGLAKKYGFNDNDFSRAKSGAKFRIRQRNALGIFKMPNSKSFPHTPLPLPLPHTPTHWKDTQRVALKLFLRVLRFANMKLIRNSVCKTWRAESETGTDSPGGVLDTVL